MSSLLWVLGAALGERALDISKRSWQAPRFVGDHPSGRHARRPAAGAGARAGVRRLGAARAIDVGVRFASRSRLVTRRAGAPGAVLSEEDRVARNRRPSNTRGRRGSERPAHAAVGSDRNRRLACLRRARAAGRTHGVVLLGGCAPHRVALVISCRSRQVVLRTRARRRRAG